MYLSIKSVSVIRTTVPTIARIIVMLLFDLSSACEPVLVTNFVDIFFVLSVALQKWKNI